MKNILLIFCLVFAAGCAAAPHRQANNGIHLVAGAQRTVCIQADPAQPEMALVVKPLEEKLEAKGYRVVPSPEKAEHTMHLHFLLFDSFASYAEARRVLASGGYRTGSPKRTKSSLSGLAEPAGTAIGGTVAGSALHAGLTTGGAVGGATGLGLGFLLSPHDPRGPFYISSIDTRISDPVKGEQHTIVGNAWHYRPDTVRMRQKAQQVAIKYLVGHEAALMP